jgi:hypothetical protein
MKKEQKRPRKTVKALIPKAGIAYKNEFYLEAIMIISAILEARLRTLITRVEKSNPGIGFNLEHCLKRVKFLHLSGRDPKLCKNLEIQMIDDLRRWKNQRNAILKDLAEIHVSHRRMEHQANEGVDLLKKFTASYRKYKKDWKASLKLSREQGVD